MVRVAVTGPESSGKSTLAAELSNYFKANLVSEVAREYLSKRNGKYKEEDLSVILRKQMEEEDRFSGSSSKILICDTEPINFLIWSTLKYGSADDEILRLVRKVNYDFYLLCYPDLVWKEDQLRENPKQEDRLNIFNEFKKNIEGKGGNYVIIRGKDRLENAIQAIQDNFEI